MKKAYMLAAFAGLLLTSASARADSPRTVINEAARTDTIDCGDGGELVVNGSSNNITVTGGCKKVVVNGTSNTVNIDAADKIVLSGTSNQVTYKRGWKKKAPKISRSGIANKIGRAR